MIKKIKNKELEEILSNTKHLANYAMPGELTLAIIAAHKELKASFETYTEACKQIGESRCEKDGNGRPLSVFQKDDMGNDLLNHPRKLKFKDLSTENDALDELKKLGEKETELKVKEVDVSVLETLKSITPIQMEAISVLIKIK